MLQPQIAKIFAEMAALLELTGANPFRVRAYAQGARVIEQLPNLETLLAADQLTTVSGIGKGLADHIKEFVATGNIAEYAALRSTVPIGVIDLLQIPGLGAKKIRTLWQEHAIVSADALETACRAHAIAAFPGFGEKSEAKILQAILQRHQYAGKFLWPVAWAIARQVADYLRQQTSVLDLAIAGSLRRCKEVVHDIDLVVSTNVCGYVAEYLLAAPFVTSVIGSGTTKTSVMVADKIQVDLRCVSPEQYPFALLHFTGSKEHNTVLRGRAKDRGLKLNEYGLFRVGADERETLIPCASETDIYRELGLHDIPPELRENLGEIVQAEEAAFAPLVSYDDLRGVFHNHTTASDGTATLTEMAAAVHARGWSYLGISDHSQSAHYAGGLKPAQIKAQWAKIEQLNATQSVHIFRGIESEILKDGALDYPDELLAQFDFVIVSLHTPFGQSRQELTERTCRALRHPATRVLAHPTGRLLLSREAYDLDMDEVLRVAGEEKVVVEINANPRRAELDWRLGKRARECGVQTMISPDAHRVDGLDDVRSGIGIARKGGWEARDVVNTWDLRKVRRWLAQKKR